MAVIGLIFHPSLLSANQIAISLPWPVIGRQHERTCAIHSMRTNAVRDVMSDFPIVFNGELHTYKTLWSGAA
jgi:hypothetical protein